MAVFREEVCSDLPNLDFSERGFEPSEIDLPKDQFAELLNDIDARNLWDEREDASRSEGLLTLSPWGFRYLEDADDLVCLIGVPELALIFEPPREPTHDNS